VQIMMFSRVQRDCYAAGVLCCPACMSINVVVGCRAQKPHATVCSHESHHSQVLCMQVTNIPLPKVRSLDPGELAARQAAIVALQQRRIAVVAVPTPASSPRAKPAASAVSPDAL